MIKEAIEKILSLAVPPVTSVGGRPYSTQTLHPVADPAIPTIKVSTLSGFVEYIRSSNLPIQGDYCDHVHIVSPAQVDLNVLMSGSFPFRNIFVSARFEAKPYPFGQWLDLETFVVALQTHFVQDETTAAILKIVGNLTSGTTVSHLDDGITQQVTAKTGIARVEQVSIPNPVTLRPYRTFLEVEQPPGLFVFRMRQSKDGIDCNLFEADCGLWKLSALDNIRAFLVSRLPDYKIIG